MRTGHWLKRSGITARSAMLERLHREIQRLFSFADLTGVATTGATQTAITKVSILSAEGLLRTLIIDIHRASDWPAIARFLEAVQTDEALPLPVVAATSTGYQIWFSLEQPVTLVDGRLIVQRWARHFADLPSERVSLYPGPATSVPLVQLVPAFDEARQRWSAFIDPGMGAMFMDDPGLDIEPNQERQADLLSAARSIPDEDIRRLLKPGNTAPDTDECAAVKQRPPTTSALPDLYPETAFTDPRDFLRAVMNSPLVCIGDRIKAAKGLLRNTD